MEEQGDFKVFIKKYLGFAEIYVDDFLRDILL